ncbi:MAG: hypothetical protein PUA47_02915 [Bacteroidales bacterium]|nr:hypothetical protein [Bacteroidales bacterium]
MNLPTIIIVILIAVLALMAVRYMVRRPSCGCSSSKPAKPDDKICPGCPLSGICSKDGTTPSKSSRFFSR